jgi:hypothetical protein
LRKFTIQFLVSMAAMLVGIGILVVFALGFVLGVFKFETAEMVIEICIGAVVCLGILSFHAVWKIMRAGKFQTTISDLLKMR